MFKEEAEAVANTGLEVGGFEDVTVEEREEEGIGETVAQGVLV